MAQRVPAGPSWDPRNQRASVVVSPACAETLAASAGRGLLAELRKSAVAFSYYRRLLARSTVEQGARAADNGTIRKSGAIRCAPIFVFIDRVPIALERALR